MIKLGIENIEQIKLGTEDITKVYLGTELIFGATIDPDVLNYITSTGETDTTFINNLNTLVSYLKSIGIYSKIQMWHLYFGNASKSKFNFINPIDSDAAFRQTYFGGGTIDNNGFLGNGVNAYANTHFIPNIQQNINNNGLTLVCSSNIPAASGDVIEFGAFDTGGQLSTLVLKTNYTDYRVGTALNNVGSIAKRDFVDESRGIFTGSKTASNIHKLFINGVLIDTGTGGGLLPNVPLYVMALNLGGGSYGPSNQNLLQSIAHEGLSDSETNLLHNALDTFENSLGRKTW